MTVHSYLDASSFLADTQTFLEKEEAVNNLILGFSNRLLNQEKQEEGYLFFCVKQVKELSLAAMRTPGRNLLIYGQANAIPALVSYLKSEAVQLPGVIGPRELGIAFSEEWKRQTANDWKLHLDQWVHRLDQVNTISVSKGSMRLAEESDMDLLEEWAYQFQLMIGDDDDREKARVNTLRRIHAQQVYIWEDGPMVSVAAVSRPTKNGITINFVYTPKEHRQKGYASSCVAALSQKMLEQGYAFCSLFTDANNPTSNKIYHLIGYNKIRPFISINFLS